MSFRPTVTKNPGPHIASQEANVGFMADPMSANMAGVSVQSMVNNMTSFSAQANHVTDLPATAPPAHARDRLTGRELLRFDANAIIGRDVVGNALSGPKFGMLDMLDNGMNKVTRQMTRQSLMPGLPPQISPIQYHDQGDVRSPQHVISQLRCSQMVDSAAYITSKVFYGLSLDTSFRSKYFIFSENTPGCLPHYRDMGVLQFADRLILTMTDSEWQDSNPNGSAQAIFPRTSGSYAAKRPDSDCPQLPWGKLNAKRIDPLTEDDFQFTPWGVAGYVGDSSGVAGAVVAYPMSGLLRLVPNVWNMCLHPPVPGAKLYFIVVRRVVGREDDHREAEQRGEHFYVGKHELLRQVIEPYVAPNGTSIDSHSYVYTQPGFVGTYWYIGYVTEMYGAANMDRLRVATQDALYPDLLQSTGASLDAIDVIDIMF